MPRIKWTPEMKDFVKANYQKVFYRELAAMINARFKTFCTESAASGLAERIDLKKGKYYRVGTEKINNKGYTIVKIAEHGPKNSLWESKHKLIWEKAHGPIPKGHIVVFLDGNKNNFALNNLAMLSKAEVVKMSQFGLFSDNREVTLAGISLVKHSMAIHGLLKKKMGERKHKIWVSSESRKRTRERKKQGGKE